MRTHRKIRRTSLAGLSCLAVATTVGACGGSDDSSTSSSSTGSSTAGSGYYGGNGSTTKTGAATTAGSSAGAAAGVLPLQADPSGALAFDRTTLTAKAGKVTLSLRNPATSGVPHAIALEGNGVDEDGKTVDPGGTSTVALTLKPGTYTFYCPVPGHEAGGMKGTLTVR